MTRQNTSFWAGKANSTDYATDASDAGFTVVDGGSLPVAVDSNYDYYVTGIMINPLSVSDTFLYQIATMDSAKATKSVKTIAFGTTTAAARSAIDQHLLKLPIDMEINYSSNACYVGIEIDFSDSDALANLAIAGYRLKKHYL